MPSTGPRQKADPVLEAAVEYFSARSHESWRRTFLKANPKEKGKPRMRLRGGVMVDVNQPWSKLHPKAQADNKRAARDAYLAVKKFPNDREAASEQVHVAWIRRNKNDASQPKALFKPYARLPEVEKDKDRAHVDNMKKALAAVRAKPRKAPRKAKSAAPSSTTVQIDAKAWKQLQSAAQQVSTALGREVSAELLLAAGAQAMAAVAKAVAAQSRTKR
jgi:hypothetical protein